MLLPPEVTGGGCGGDGTMMSRPIFIDDGERVRNVVVVRWGWDGVWLSSNSTFEGYITFGPWDQYICMHFEL